MKKIIDALPLVVFASLIIVLFSFLSDKDDQLETALIDSSFPDFNLGSLSDESRLLTKRDIIKLPALINVWATWCIACRVEHPFLMKLKEESILTIYGLNYKDNELEAKKFIEGLGNPFKKIGVDASGRSAIDLGVYGVPETFIIQNGIITYKHIGPIHMNELDEKILPIIKGL